MTELVVISFLVVVAALLVFFRINYAKIRGKFGEKRISKLLMYLPDEYTIFNDVYIHENSKSVQIDHIVLSPYGIFVIETKNFKGWIYGSENATQWAQNIYGTKFMFHNPLLQNYSHVKALHSLFGYPIQFFIPIVVFVGNAELKGNYPNHNVVYRAQLLSTIEQYKNVVLRDDMLQNAIGRLSYSSFKTKETASLHVKQVRSEVQEKKAKISQGICPRCGSELIYKKGKYGSFYGCSSYPKCRYTLKKV